jgi:ADP-L-glycero-D-manno-heptose 6-epimerase
MFVVTGAAGFISSCLISKLNSEGYEDLILVDEFEHAEKNKNFENKKFSKKIHRNEFVSWLSNNADKVKYVFHLGAKTNTAEFDIDLLNKLNLNYSKSLFKICTDNNIPFIYASSAATYGGGEFGYDDDHSFSAKLKPLNPYGDSKNDFDIWLLGQDTTPPFWAGLKFFNVYGPNEYHKGRMASVVLHAFRQIKETNAMKLFRSHHPDFKDGEQLRDFVYVKDVVSVIDFLFHHSEPKNAAIYNLGTGKARTFLDLVKNTFEALNLEEQISFIDTPIDIRDKYQYFTEAKMDKLINVGYNKPFTSLEDGVKDYVQNYLVKGSYL